MKKLEVFFVMSIQELKFPTQTCCLGQCKLAPRAPTTHFLSRKTLMSIVYAIIFNIHWFSFPFFYSFPFFHTANHQKLGSMKAC